MSVWTEEELGILRDHYIGFEEDFPKLVEYLAAHWTAADIERLKRSGQGIAWDDYFQQVKLLSYRAGDN